METKPSIISDRTFKRKLCAIGVFPKLEPITPPESKRRILDGVMLDFENKQRLYMLRAHDKQQMLAHNGFLSRLDGKSPKQPIYRWQCIRYRDIDCKAFIYTECGPDNVHKLKPARQALHNHEAYTPAQLRKLCTRHNIKVENSEVGMLIAENAAIKREPQEEPEPKSQPKYMKLKPNDPLRRTTATTTTTSTSPPQSKKNIQINQLSFHFLPTKGKTVQLAIEDYVFNLDNKNPQNGHSYWSCSLRRDKDLKCTARAVLKNTTGGPVILALSGEHNHPILNNVKKQQVRSQPPKALLNAKTMRGAVQKSQEVIQRGIKRLQAKLQVQSYSKLNASRDRDDNDDTLSLSSISDGFETDEDDFDLINDRAGLPTSIEAMRKKCVKNEEKIVQEDNITDSANDEQTQENENTASAYEEEATTAEQDEVEEELMVEEYLDTQDDDWFEMDKQHFMEEEPNESQETAKSKETPESEQSPQSNPSPADSELEQSPTGSSSGLRKLFQDPHLDITKVSKLRSAHGGEQLCVDGYIYHVKSICGLRTYWECIKSRDPTYKCKARLTTAMDNEAIKVMRTTNTHSHGINEDDIKRRLYNEITARGVVKVKSTKNLISEKSLAEVNREYADVIGHSFDGKRKTMKLYSLHDGPPSIAVRMTLAALKIPYELVNIDYMKLEHMTDEYEKLNPQKEVPVLDDNGFYLPESIAIMQYLCDKYASDNEIYPKEAQQRALVNHRLCFNMGFYYSSILAHTFMPVFFDMERTELTLKKTRNALSVFGKYLQRAGTKYAAADHLTIADFPLVAATMCLEAIEFDLSPYPLVSAWYENFKTEYPELWNIAKEPMAGLKEMEKNRPDLSNLNHPLYPSRKADA